MDSAIDWKEKQLTKRVKFQSELTELKARDTSCPRGKKVELKIIRTIGICEGGIYYEYRVLAILFVIIGVLFAIFKEKAAKFVSGFNSLPKEEQALYDKAHISRDIRNQCFMWAIIMLAGALLSCFLTPYIAIPTYIIWLVLFFREVHFDNHKAFEKYLLK